MTLIEIIKKRKSVRKFTDQDVSDEDIMEILEAARLAPSGVNKQPWQFIIIRNKETQQQIAKIMSPWAKFIKLAPVAIALIVKTRSPWHLLDGAIAMEHLILAAAEKGLGTCWTATYGITNPKDFQSQLMDLFEVPKELQENFIVLTITPLGYPAEGGILETKRKPIDAIHSLEKFEIKKK